MAMTEQLYATMCAYFDGKLSLEEEKKFLAAVDSDPELRKEFEWEESILYSNALKRQGGTELVIASDGGLLNTGYEAAVTDGGVLIMRPGNAYRRRQIAVAGLVLAILVLAFIYYNRQVQTIPWKQLDWAGITYPAAPDTAVKKQQVDLNNPPKQNTNNDLIAAAAKAKARRDAAVNKIHRYQPDLEKEFVETTILKDNHVSGNFEANTRITRDDLKTRGGNPEQEKIFAYADFYKGIAYIELNNDSAAVRILSKLNEAPIVPELVQEVRWNLAKALYKSGSKQVAVKLLNALLINPAFEKKTAVKALLQMIQADKP